MIFLVEQPKTSAAKNKSENLFERCRFGTLIDLYGMNAWNRIRTMTCACSAECQTHNITDSREKNNPVFIIWMQKRRRRRHHDYAHII